jgi:CyaY protein
MSQPDFDTLSETTLEQIRQALEASGMDADVEIKAEGVLEVEFEDGAKMIINRHRPAQEIWVAARAGGFHFRWDGSAWRNTRDGRELYEALSELVSAEAGAPVVLAAQSGVKPPLS